MVTIRELFDAGVHFGHQTRVWHPNMAPYIYGKRNKIHIIDLEKTLPLLEQAMEILSDIAAKKGKILFVGTKRAAREMVKEKAQECNMPYVDYRWLGGTLTNWQTVRQSIKRFKNLEKRKIRGEFKKLTKKEALLLERELEKYERSLGGIKNMHGLPQALLVIDVGNERIAVQEAKKLKIPVIGVVDTNEDPTVIDYPIPGNDDARKAIALYLQCAVDAIQNGRRELNLDEMAMDDFVEVPEEVTEEAVATELLEDEVKE